MLRRKNCAIPGKSFRDLLGLPGKPEATPGDDDRYVDDDIRVAIDGRLVSRLSITAEDVRDRFVDRWPGSIFSEHVVFDKAGPRFSNNGAADCYLLSAILPSLSAAAGLRFARPPLRASLIVIERALPIGVCAPLGAGVVARV